MEKISVIVPIYNSEKYLEKTIDSVLNQTYGNFEIICVNDGSTDKSLEIIEKLSKFDNRIIVISQKNQGGSVARNTGLKNAAGDYIAFLDNDDLYHPEYLEILHRVLRDTGADLSICRNTAFPDGQEFEFPEKYDPKKIKIKGIYRHPFFSKFIMKADIPMLMWVKLAKKEVYKGIEFSSKLPAINDILWNMEVLYNSKKCITICEKLISWRYRPDSQTNVKLSEKKLLEFYNLIVELNNFLNNHRLNFIERFTIRRLIAKKAYQIFISERIKDGTFFEYRNQIVKHLNKLVEEKTFNPKYLNPVSYFRFRKYFK